MQLLMEDPQCQLNGGLVQKVNKFIGLMNNCITYFISIYIYFMAYLHGLYYNEIRRRIKINVTFVLRLDIQLICRNEAIHAEIP